MFKSNHPFIKPLFLLSVLLISASCDTDADQAVNLAVQTVAAQQTQTAEADTGLSVDEAVELTVAAQNAAPTLSVEEQVALTVAAQAPPTLTVDEQVALTVAANEAANQSSASGVDAEAPEGTPEVVVQPTDATSSVPQVRVRVSANVRQGPGTNYPIITALGAGSVVDVVAKNNQSASATSGWRLIKLPNGQLGWMAASVTEYTNVADAANVPVAATIPAPPAPTAVSYTHLTLPTICSV